MTTEEFSNEFDIAVNAYLPDGVLFNEYEKSKYLTQAQEQLVLQLYASFEQKEVIREILSPLVKTAVIKEEYTGLDENGETITDLYPISDHSFFFQLPDDLWLITFEEVVIDSDDKCLKNKRLSVSPVTQDKLSKILGNPFKGANDNRALRLNIEDNVVEIISKHDVKRYYVRYIKKPRPIILTDLRSPNNIDFVSFSTKLSDGRNVEIFERTECELHESVHRNILDLAVALALKTRNVTKAMQQTQVQQPQQQTEQ